MNDGRFFSENVVSTATVSLRIAGEAAPLGWLNCVIQQQRCGRKYSLVWWAQFCCHWSAVDAGKYHEIAGLNRIFDARWCMGESSIDTISFFWSQIELITVQRPCCMDEGLTRQSEDFCCHLSDRTITTCIKKKSSSAFLIMHVDKIFRHISRKASGSSRSVVDKVLPAQELLRIHAGQFLAYQYVYPYQCYAVLLTE